MGTFVLVPIFPTVKKSDITPELFPKSFHEPLIFADVQAKWVAPLFQISLVKGKCYETVLFVHLCFMHDPYGPLAAVIKPASNTLATRYVKALCKRKGLVKDNLPFAFIGE